MWDASERPLFSSEDAAATCIQRLWRGHSIRRRLIETVDMVSHHPYRVVQALLHYTLTPTQSHSPTSSLTPVKPHRFFLETTSPVEEAASEKEGRKEEECQDLHALAEEPMAVGVAVAVELSPTSTRALTERVASLGA
jgi:hypothetical protein